MYESIPELGEPVCEPTTLYGIQPIGIGTAFVESLSSFVLRLSAAHMLRPSALMKYVIGASIDYEKHNLSSTIGGQRIIKGMNGNGREALALVDTVEKLTGQKGLKFLTMSPFSKLFSKKDLVSSVSAWCPYCLNQQREMGQTIYFPLLWCLSLFSTCRVHGNRLVTVCPHCKLSSPTLSSRTVVGYCGKCKSWLGAPLAKGISVHKVKKDCFITSLIERGREFADYEDKPTFPSLLKYLMGNKMKMSDSVALARLLKYGDSTILNWLSGEDLPSLKAVLLIAGRFKLDPMDILITSGEEMSRRDREVISAVDNPDDYLSTFDWERLHGLLKDVANGKASAMRVEDIACVYKCRPDQITSMYPELCLMIESRYEQMVRHKMHSNDEGTVTQKVDSIVDHFVLTGIEPTEERVLDIVGPRGLWIYSLVIYKYSLNKNRNATS